MEKAFKYKTKQRQAILAFFSQKPKEAITAHDVCENLKDCGIEIGLTTVYRCLEHLEKEGVITRHVVDGNSSAFYQFVKTEEENFMLKCENCGCLTRFECHEIDAFYHHFAKEHNIQVNPHKTVFYGQCEHCMGMKG